jgi:hypothetical protein
MVSAAYPRSCEFFVSSIRKKDGVLIERCSLTGKGCFCEGVTYLTCTRRTFALLYEARRSGVAIPTQPDPIVKVVCSEDNPQRPLPYT